MQYDILFDGDILSEDLDERIALNRNLPRDFCKKNYNSININATMFKNFDDALSILNKHLISESHEKVQVLVDCDADGYLSGAIAYMTMQDLFDNDSDVEYLIHEKHLHGLSEDITVADDTTLLIIPDAGSNDIDKCKELHNKGVDIIILDHHHIEQENPYACVLNCQDGVFPNPHLCGTAVTWMFCAFVTHSIKHLDYVGVATIADIMQTTNDTNMFFVRHIESNELCVPSNALKAFYNGQTMDMSHISIEDIKFKVAPLISALIRIGTMEEKEILFNSLAENYEEFEYVKRGSKTPVIENIYDRAFRLCRNAKARQDNAKKKIVKECDLVAYDNIVFVEVNCEHALCGLVANELASSLNIPTLVYRNVDGHYVGSARCYDGCTIPSLRDAINDTGKFEFAAGHDSAFGFSFLENNLDEIHEAFTNSIGQEVSDSVGGTKFNVDFRISYYDLTDYFVKNITKYDDYSGNGFRQVTAIVEGIPVSKESFKTMGKDSISFKIVNEDSNIVFVMFKISEDDFLYNEFEWGSEEEYYIDAICSFSVNTYNGITTLQGIIKDYDMSYFTDDWE